MFSARGNAIPTLTSVILLRYSSVLMILDIQHTLYIFLKQIFALKQEAQRSQNFEMEFTVKVICLFIATGINIYADKIVYLQTSKKIVSPEIKGYLYLSLQIKSRIRTNIDYIKSTLTTPDSAVRVCIRSKTEIKQKVRLCKTTSPMQSKVRFTKSNFILLKSRKTSKSTRKINNYEGAWIEVGSLRHIFATIYSIGIRVYDLQYRYTYI